MRIPAFAVVLVGVVVSCPSAFAQPATTAALVGKMENISVYPVWALKMTDKSYAETGYGIEFTFFLGADRREMSDRERDAECDKVNKALRNEGKPETCDSKRKSDTTKVLTELRKSGANVDSVFTVTIEKLEVTRIQFELGVANNTTELRHGDPVNNWDLTGRIVEFPVLSLYGTIRPDWPVSPYLGLRFALAELKSVRISQADSSASVDDDAVALGAAGGAVYERSGFNFFAEVSYSALRFNTPQWKTPSTLSALAGSFPRRLDLTGLRFSVGVAISLSEK